VITPVLACCREVLHVSIFLYLAVYMILFAYSIIFCILGSIHDIFLYLTVYIAYIHITLVTHIIFLLDI
jgi:hypothetical protein